MSRKVKIRKKKPSLKKIQIFTKPKLLKIKKIGKWCEYFEGRLPYPIECTYNKETPKTYIYEGKTKTLSKNTPNCPTCKRSVEWDDWKNGKWNKVREEIKKGHDLSDQPSPIINKENI